MTYRLGANSLRQLEGVHPRLVAVVHRAITLTEQDFAVTDGVRTPEEQGDLVARGASQTVNSMHLRQSDGWGHAVDLVPYWRGGPRWEWPLFFPMVAAVHRAARQEAVALRWGGVWDQPFLGLPGTAQGLEEAVAAYAQRRRKAGRRAFLDGPHFELA